MKTIAVAEAARDFPRLLAEARRSGEDVLIVENGETLATLVPESAGQTALEIFADLEGTLDDEAGEALRAAVAKIRESSHGRLDQLRAPWVG